ncbi:hypothetical protein XENTR_v10007801 [Xenopus tropicalis]|nr:hypothetical protein XENTR_v10007801 [Xenopus tropicalis]
MYFCRYGYRAIVATILWVFQYSLVSFSLKCRLPDLPARFVTWEAQYPLILQILKGTLMDANASAAHITFPAEPLICQQFLYQCRI